MSIIVTRAGKGSPLTNAEVDANFTNLNTDKLEASALSPYLLSATASSTYQTIAGMSSYLTTSSASSTYLTQSSASSTYAPLASPTLTGTPAAPTAAVDTNTTQIATTAFVVGQDYLKSATASSTYQTQAGMSSYLTTASAASTYLPLAGGTLTGNAVISVNSATDALRITQVGAGNALLVEDSANPDATPFVVDASGRLVVGNTSALSATGGVPNIQYVGSAVPLGVFGFNSTAATGAVTFARSKSATIGTNAALVSGDQIAVFRFQGADGGTAYLDGAQILAVADGSFTPTSSPGRLVFSTTADGASSPTERMRIDSAGQVTIGGTATAGQNVRVAKNITGSTTGRGVLVTSTIQSDVTSVAYGYSTFLGTQATSFTLTSLSHYHAQQGTIGATSTVTNQYGYFSDSSLTGATNNYGFYSNIAAPTSGITTTGTISSISSSGTTVTVNHNAITYTNGQTVTVTATANATALTSGCTCTILTVGTTDFTAIGAASNTVGTSFTATGAGTGTGTVTLNVQGSGKTVAGAASGSFTFTTTTSQTFAAVTVTGSVTVSLRYNLFANGTADNYFAGAVGIGVPSLTGRTLALAKTITGATTSYGILNNGVVQSDVTVDAQYYNAVGSTAAAAFTLTNLRGYYYRQATIGATSAVTNQFGFFVESDVTGATNNFGFYSNIASGTGRWNFYANGTADNYFGGKVGIGSVPSATNNLFLTLPATGGTVFNNFIQQYTIQSDVTSQARSFVSAPATAAAAFTLNQLYHFLAGQGTIGATSAVTNQYGFFAQNTLIGATNNFGFYSDIASGSGRWNFYANGTAANYFGGEVQLASNLTFSGLGRRITGDFSSNNPITDRILVQTSAANANTLWSILPSGTSTTSRYIAFNNSDPTNAGAIQVSALSTDVRIQSFANGTASAIPLMLMMQGTTVATISTNANLLVGTTTDDAANKLQLVGSARIQAAAAQDAILLAGRAGGTGSFAVTLTPATLASNTTLTLPNVTSTLAALDATQTFTATQTFSGSSSVLGAILTDAAEVATVSATAATGTINYDVTTQSVLYYTSNASANWTVNFRGSSGTSLNTLMSIGQSLTVAFLVTQGATAYYNNVVQVDGANVTPKYQGGTAWTAGNASSIDAYVYTIVKTGNAAFTVFASQTQFK